MNDLELRLTDLAAGFDGRVGVAATLLKAGGPAEPLARVNAEEAFPAASLIKVPILIAALARVDEGLLDLRERVTIRDRDRAGGSGVLGALEPGLAPTVGDLLRLMVVVSDNTATNLVLERLGGPDSVNAFLDAAGCRVTRALGPLQVPPERQTPAQRAGGRAMTTAAEMEGLLAGLQAGLWLSPASRAFARDCLAGQQANDAIPRHLPASVPVAHKTGELPGVRNDAGLVSLPGGTVVMALLSRGPAVDAHPVGWPGTRLLARVAAELVAAAGA